ncbi:UNKNOWN [Stylonychia lemnae]|uniref:Uncharacterized protein n=1 Tax=Stylonychia lemnae TaxID=5949 RepID=A0A078AG37_STYLE|nr:UNKNOWN [Stylonychia lemnae]|eukprot:CDW79838.1 UNKNOWN [Stylonychia lemnae]
MNQTPIYTNNPDQPAYGQPIQQQHQTAHHDDHHHDKHHYHYESHETCCCCVSIRSAPRIIGALDIVYFIFKAWNVIKYRNIPAIFYGDLLIVLLICIPRIVAFYFYQKNHPHHTKHLDTYIKARFYTLMAMLAEVVIISIILFGFSSDVKNSGTDDDSKELASAGSSIINAFIVAFYIVPQCIFMSFDLYYSCALKRAKAEIDRDENRQPLNHV